MASKASIILLTAANILIPVAILIFASGFFPYKPFLPGLAKYETAEYGEPPVAPFDKVVFMVVDALRSDFVFSESSGFWFTQNLISNGAAIPFTAHATSPTITMPRIKAITTGSTPSFLDVILNFAESDTSSSLATQDTWLAQMKAKKTGKLVMYGDDTWLKLFPGVFDRADGTSSFFVSDFTEVDHNVTRHVPGELKLDDWSTMVLHYLGLDHIGHKTGPRGPNMIPKQREMDGIVKQIYQAMETEDHLSATLLVLCGDHGMNDAGNHGGSSPGETSPALVFMSPKLKSITSGVQSPAQYKEDFQYYTTVDQSDIAPTLGALLGFPIPRNSLGSFIVEFLPLWSSKDRLRIMIQNAQQIASVVSAAFPAFRSSEIVQSPIVEELGDDVETLAYRWDSLKGRILSLEIGDYDIYSASMSEWTKKGQELMTGTASNYDISKLTAGQSLSGIALLFALAAAWSTISSSFRASCPFLLIAILYGVMMFASSYVEEEQHFWYWTSTAWLGYLGIKNYRKSPLPITIFVAATMLLLLRIIRRWNQTGQKWAGEPDISSLFFDHKLIFWCLVGATYLWNLQSLANCGFSLFPKMAGRAIGAALSTAAVTFKLAFTIEDSPELMLWVVSPTETDSAVNLVTRAKIAFMAIGMAVAYTIVTGFAQPRQPETTMRTMHNLLVLFLTVQCRTTNIPLLLLFEALFYIIMDLNISLIEISTTSLLLQYASFFALSGSNAISSIDLSSAYNGISGYNVIAVGVLTFVSNWIGPIYWTSAAVTLLLRLKRQEQTEDDAQGRGEKAEDLYFKYLALQTVFITSSLVSTMVACTQLRTHLFIWTVFSPKYLFSMAWSLGMHLGISVVVGSVLFGLGHAYM
ncbi:GPI ethanolamine phosphate transferas-like protein 2 [Calycina marina]|uniref:GPI ethanolamine phosphate transferase 2 n=1 Tax=Calycina marina TaxID=1763456 RepID=A0A9P7YZC0_9HELO|nr:GPI ethanolamine phosphate transferas-like protein 2 [Calycina marina]